MISANDFSEEISEGSAGAETSLGVLILSRYTATTWMSSVLESRPDVEHMVGVVGVQSIAAEMSMSRAVSTMVDNDEAS